MVQRKAPQRRLGSQAEPKIKTRKTNSEQQDAGSRGGGGDLQKKMKMERSIIAAELDKNYMKPTSSSKSRRRTENPRAPPSEPPPKKALKGATARRRRKKSPRGVVVVSRATCSSTQKGSRFPEALDLAPGGTSAAARVCPYAYCSLNGHGHEPLPPLGRFVSARRRLLKTQKTAKLTALSSFKVKGVEAEEEKALASCSSTEQAACNDDFFVEIYTTKPAGEQSKPEVEDADGELGEDGHEASDEDVDVTMKFVEYVECDRRVEEEEEEEEEEAEPIISECSEDGLLREEEDEDDTNEELCGLANAYEPESSEEDNATEVAVFAEDHGKNDTVEHDESTGVVEDASSLSIAQLFDDSHDSLSELEQAAAEGDRVRGFRCNGDAEDVTSPDESERARQERLFNLGESIDEMKARMRITRKKMSEDPEETRGFNPRGPRFLPAEPDPDAEKVDLRHQTMDERKNSEEWMIDYALRRAVTKLAPAPKKKVAVLVEAFETVAPLPAWRKPRRHSTPGFGHARIIQACN